MKKQLLTAALLMGAFFTVNAQWTEDFEGTWPPTGWTIETTNADWTWEPIGDGALGGDFSANVQYDEDLDNQDESLITPEFTVPADSPKLTFLTSLSYNWAVTEANYDFIISVSTDGGTTWTAIWDETELGVFPNFETIDVEVSLSAYAGQSVKLNFQYVGSDGAQLVLDDVAVTGGTAGLNENLASKLSVYPNPANNVVTIDNNENIQISAISIVDINGRTVKYAQYDGVSNAQINISELSSGMYMMNIASDQGMTTKKIVKN